MKKFIILFFANVLLLNFSFSKTNFHPPTDSDYSVSNIPEELLKNADAVIRMDYTFLEVESIKRATVYRKYAITILNSNADELANFREYYDPFIKINNIKGVIYDKNGAVVRKIKKKEIEDYSAVSGGSLYEDNRIKVIQILHNSYPYTIEFEFDEKYKGIMSYPSWMPVPGYEIAVQESTYKAMIPDELGFRYKSKNYDNEPVTKKVNDLKMYEWKIENFSALKREPYSPHYQSFFPMVLIAPNEFEYDGWEGNMSSWKNFGDFLFELAKGRDELKSETISAVKSMTQNAKSEEEKVKIIYEYLQSKTRYISIQLGIGGWQPFEAKTVDKTGYGDCKALSNYTNAMLKSIGIESYNVVIGAGRSGVSLESDFPGLANTNHMILCVPLENDTIWLECTSQNQPFGFMGSFTDNRNALLITKEGGKVVKTPRYHQSINTQKRTATIKIDAEGNADAAISTKYQGLQYENIDRQFARNEKEKKDYLYGRLDIANMEIEKFNYSQIKNRIPEATEELELKVKNYASVSGKRVFIPLNILNKRKKAPKKIKNRKTDVALRSAYIDVDQITYELPKDFHIEHMPESVEIESDFGSYKATVIQDGHSIIYKRTVKMNKKTFPADRYNDFRTFYKKMVRADKMKLVIVNKT